MIELIDARDRQVAFVIERPRPRPGPDVDAEVDDIVQEVRLRGDAAVLDYTSRFDGVALTSDGLRVDPAAVGAALQLVNPGLLDALEALAVSCRQTCERSLPSGWLERNGDEVRGEVVRPVRRAGFYLPPGPPGDASTVIACVVPARVAGVEEVAVCAAPARSGDIADQVLAACAVAGVDEVYRIGGAQAIAAMAYGTETVRPVDVIAGRGGQLATAAQRAVRGWVGTGPESGPAELVIIADETATPEVVAADLIANASRGVQGTHAVVTPVGELLDGVLTQLDRGVAGVDRSGDLENALIEGGRGILVRDLQQAVEITNAFAPSHLMLSVAGAEEWLPSIRSAGCVLLGDGAPPQAAAFFSGVGGLLPAGGTARWDSGLSPRYFLKSIIVAGGQRSSLDRVAHHAHAVADAAGSPADARSIDLRLHL